MNSQISPSKSYWNKRRKTPFGQHLSPLKLISKSKLVAHMNLATSAFQITPNTIIFWIVFINVETWGLSFMVLIILLSTLVFRHKNGRLRTCRTWFGDWNYRELSRRTESFMFSFLGAVYRDNTSFLHRDAFSIVLGHITRFSNRFSRFGLIRFIEIEPSPNVHECISVERLFGENTMDKTINYKYTIVTYISEFIWFLHFALETPLQIILRLPIKKVSESFYFNYNF